MSIPKYLFVKFIYSEKATKIWKNFHFFEAYYKYFFGLFLEKWDDEIFNLEFADL